MARRMVIRSPARLHFGLVNPFNREYRLYVSAGVAIDYPKTQVVVYPDEQLHIEGCREDEVRKRIEPLIEELKLRKGRLVIEKCIPKHVGLGSTTQLLLSAAHGLLLANEVRNFDLVSVAKKLGIGKISGVGTYVYMYGGFVVDAGKAKEEDFPELMLRLPFPEDWAFIVAIPRGSGLDEKREELVFTESGSVHPEIVWHASFTLFHELVPALMERSFVRFSSALSKLQELVGTMFSKYQGGVFASYSKQAIDVLREAGVIGVGQSSWGPTVYGVVESRAKATEISNKISEVSNNSVVFISEPRNRGADVYIEVY